MSTGDLDPFLLVVQPELANDEEITALETLAADALGAQPADYTEQWGFCIPETGAELTIIRSVPEDPDEAESSLRIILGRDTDAQGTFFIRYPEGRQPEYDYDSDDPTTLFDAVQIADELLKAPHIDPRTVEVLEYAKLLALSLYEAHMLGEISEDLANDETAERTQVVALLATALVDDYARGILRVRESSVRDTSTGEELTITCHEIVASREGLEGILVEEVPQLEIRFYDPESKRTYWYTVEQDYERKLYVVGEGPEYDVEDFAIYDEDADEDAHRFNEDGTFIPSLLDDERPVSHDVNYLIQKLNELT